MTHTRLTSLIFVALLVALLVGCGRDAGEEEPIADEPQAQRTQTLDDDPEPLASDRPALSLPEVDRNQNRDREMPRVGDADAADADRPTTPEEEERVDAGNADASAMLNSANAVYARLLSAVVTEDGLVDYEQLEQRIYHNALDSVISAYSQLVLPENDATRLALLVNAYNANVLHLVIKEREDPDFDHVMGVSGFFDQREITVAGETMTLNELEHDRIRPMGDPRVHAALVSGAMSCPPLHDEPFTGENLDEQLDAQSHRWVNDPSRNRVDEGILKLSSTFQWFGQDFEVEPYEGVIGYVKHYAASGSRLEEFLREDAHPEIEWLEYDWTLNRAVVQRSPEK